MRADGIVSCRWSKGGLFQHLVDAYIPPPPHASSGGATRSGGLRPYRDVPYDDLQVLAFLSFSFFKQYYPIKDIWFSPKVLRLNLVHNNSAVMEPGDSAQNLSCYS